MADPIKIGDTITGTVRGGQVQHVGRAVSFTHGGLPRIMLHGREQALYNARPLSLEDIERRKVRARQEQAYYVLRWCTDRLKMDDAAADYLRAMGWTCTPPPPSAQPAILETPTETP